MQLHSSARAGPRVHGRDAPRRGVITAYQAPSATGGATELSLLSRVTDVVPDSIMGKAAGKPKAATVSFAVLHGIVHSQQLGVELYKNAVTAAANCDRCQTPGIDKLACQLDKAMTNVGSMLAEEVEGRVCTEVDHRLANNTDALVKKANELISMYDEDGVPHSKLILQLPGTWAGIQAAKALEARGVATQISHVYSLVQGVAAAQAGASVLLVSVGRIQTWYSKHPGVIRDPHGPRQDAGGAGGVDPGIKLAQDLWCYCRRFHPKTKVMVASVRSRDDALALSGIDYMILGPKVMKSLEGAPTVAGYNDGLHTDDADGGLDVALTEAVARASDVDKMPAITESSFKEGLGLAGAELLAESLQERSRDAELMKPFFATNALGVGA